jgi:hypothetical protein
VPERVWVDATRPSLTAGESPKRSLRAPVQKGAEPSIGKYS